MPLRELLKKDRIWIWTETQRKAFHEVKVAVSNPPVLANFDENKNTLIQTDASQDGLGCCLLQENKPVAYASRSLTETEKRYAQIDKEFLAINFACKKFHYYVYGRKVQVDTDHKPIVAIMQKDIADVHSPRLQRIKINLLKYDLIVKYKPGKDMHIADLLSRNYLKNEVDDTNYVREVVHTVQIGISDVRKKEFEREIQKDEVMQKLIEHYYGWPKERKGTLEGARSYWPVKNELYVENGLIFMDDRVIVPKALRASLLKALHVNHLGINKTQQRAKQILYWPGMSRDIEQLIINCSKCEQYKSNNRKEPLMSHKIPELPFNKVASDILEYGGNSYLVVQDYLTKWTELVKLDNKQSSSVIEAFKKIFSAYGIPEVVVADNMPYNSWKCAQFAKQWKFKFVTSSPRYPRSNGLAERTVQSMKQALRKCDDIYLALLEYRNTPILGTKKSPAQLLLNRELRSTMLVHPNRLKPEITNYREEKDKIEKKMQENKENYDKRTRERESFNENQTVTVKEGREWIPAKIVEKDETPRSYWLMKENGNIVRRNSFHLRKSNNEPSRRCCDIDEEKEASVSPNNDNNRSERRRRNICKPSRFNDYIMY